MKILILNAGSSSLKYELFESRADSRVKSIFSGIFDGRGKPIRDYKKAVLKVKTAIEAKFSKETRFRIAVIGHRVVHGGEIYKKPVVINKKVIKEIRKLSNLAPLHNPPNLACILACKKLFPNIRQIAVFDTSFHQTMPEKAFLYALPYKFYKKYKIRRYGFHGTSHQYVFEKACEISGRKIKKAITCHLGNGGSITAIKNGKVIDTSMGFTPLEGIPMGTRSGDIDPSIIFYLLEKGFSAKEINEILNKKSGLLGVSEISPDMRKIWKKYKEGDKKANRALEFFAYRVAKYISSYVAALGGLDALIFTAGIGENAWYLRKMILSYLKWLPKKRVFIIPTDEEKKIAEEVLKMIK